MGVRTITGTTSALGGAGSGEGTSEGVGRQGRPGLARRVEDLTSVATPPLAPAQAARAAAESATRMGAVASAIWLAAGGSSSLALAALAGPAGRDRARLEGAWSHLPHSLLGAGPARAEAARELARVLCVDHVAVTAAGPCLVAVAGARERAHAMASVVASLLESKLAGIADTTPAGTGSRPGDLELAWVAHELMAPLVAVRAAVDHLTAGGAERSGEESETLREVAVELDHLVRLCDGLLREPTPAAGAGGEAVDVRDLAQEVARSCRLEGSGHNITVAVPPGVLVGGDRVQLRIVVSNLVRNSLAYSPPSGTVTVSTEENDGSVTVTVEDEGPGIRETERERIFHPFVRGSAAEDAAEGHGLGLYIARRLVDDHGGALWAEPRARGAAFKVRLPVPGGGAVGTWAS
ncbi:MAG TPA: HAMP domain-containing sensor histidine kinase [Actinomycetota bacterium]|nr:HAMP domain-containing sensor histidine kinase [Actinomycetota bacterium]